MLKGCIITVDAMRCQTEITEQIIECGGDYVLEPKDYVDLDSQFGNSNISND